MKADKEEELETTKEPDDIQGPEEEEEDDELPDFALKRSSTFHTSGARRFKPTSLTVSERQELFKERMKAMKNEGTSLVVTVHGKFH